MLGIKVLLHPVSDLAAARVVYTALLGVAPQTDSEYYVGFDVCDQHIGAGAGRRTAGADLTGRLT
jgi:hypothetical protein